MRGGLRGEARQLRLPLVQPGVSHPFPLQRCRRHVSSPSSQLKPLITAFIVLSNSEITQTREVQLIDDDFFRKTSHWTIQPMGRSKKNHHDDSITIIRFS